AAELSSNDVAGLFLNGTMRFKSSDQPAPPVVEVIQVAPTSGGTATVTGEIVSYDTTQPNVKIYWGDEDAGPTTEVDENNASKWDGFVTVAGGNTLGFGEFNATIVGMTPGTLYHFRAYAEAGTDGHDWSSGDPTVRADLAAYWRFDEETGPLALDSTRNNRDVVLINFDASASRTDGYVGGALIFEGTDDWVNLDEDGFFLKDSFDGRSVSFRLKPASNFFVGPAVTRYEDLVGYW
ncbi:uncharacterized protein METZ01_LOCUS494769, partial [marine metagenome]